MPSIGPFSDFRLRDKVGLAAFLDAHERQHMEYEKHLQLPGGSLEGPVDGDWMLRHAMRHERLATALGKPSLGSTAGLALAGAWKTDQQLSDWHMLHNRLHFNIELLLNIAGRSGGVPHGG